MSDAQFERKMALCREVLAVLDKVMPGRSRKRGNVTQLQYMYACIAICFNDVVHDFRYDAVRAPPAAGDAGQSQSAKGSRGQGGHATEADQAIPEGEDTF